MTGFSLRNKAAKVAATNLKPNVMAEINQENQAGSTPKKIRSRKLNSKVDLTAMVDLAFLLITFFMLTTSLSKPKSMHLSMPADGPSQPVDENRTMTILVGQGKAKCYMGQQTKDAKEIALGNQDLRRELTVRKKQAIDYSKDPNKGLIVLIKPGEKSQYGNVVDVLDEMAISNIDRYAVVDIEKSEADLLAR
ncbi:Biopolymer transport protein ExbD [Flavobacterium caeni]|uniref:Biopolymer transport protein ExbD n=2 Tax=Flavobacterium caeni TaxID=490189 RepID=A0A1G5JH04_9FLAO|nr:Biopolymer transport protein ExbD [Flavobacterium caeni]